VGGGDDAGLGGGGGYDREEYVAGKEGRAFLIGKRRLSEVNYLNGLCGAGEKDSVFVLEGHAPCWALPRLTRLENQRHKGVVHKTTGNKRHSLRNITIKPNCANKILRT
jgi:hypothetical protein